MRHSRYRLWLLFVPSLIRWFYHRHLSRFLLSSTIIATDIAAMLSSKRIMFSLLIESISSTIATVKNIAAITVLIIFIVLLVSYIPWVSNHPANPISAISTIGISTINHLPFTLNDFSSFVRISIKVFIVVICFRLKNVPFLIKWFHHRNSRHDRNRTCALPK